MYTATAKKSERQVSTNITGELTAQQIETLKDFPDYEITDQVPATGTIEIKVENMTPATYLIRRGGEIINGQK